MVVNRCTTPAMQNPKAVSACRFRKRNPKEEWMHRPVACERGAVAALLRASYLQKKHQLALDQYSYGQENSERWVYNDISPTNFIGVSSFHFYLILGPYRLWGDELSMDSTSDFSRDTRDSSASVGVHITPLTMVDGRYIDVLTIWLFTNNWWDHIVYPYSLPLYRPYISYD